MNSRHSSQPDPHHGEADAGFVRAFPARGVQGGTGGSDQQEAVEGNHQRTQPALIHHQCCLHPAHPVRWVDCLDDGDDNDDGGGAAADAGDDDDDDDDDDGGGDGNDRVDDDDDVDDDDYDDDADDADNDNNDDDDDDVLMI